MISFFLPDWFVSRLLDLLVEADDVKAAGVPESMTLLGVLLIPVGVGVLVWLVTRAVMLGRLADEPEVEAPARSADVTEEILRFVADRLATDRREKPAPRHRAPRSHVVPAHPANDTTVVIPQALGADPDATVAMDATRR